MRMLIIYITLVVGCCMATNCAAQGSIPISVKGEKVAYEGDSIPHIIFPTLHKHPPLKFKNARAQNKYNRLVYNVKRVLPLAKLVRQTIIETYELLELLPEKDRAAHLKRVEKGLLEQYGPRIRKLSRTQGRILVKLVDRECNNTGYAITKAFIGATRANIYQGLALCLATALPNATTQRARTERLRKLCNL